MGTWLNDDGLYRKFGTSAAEHNNGGEYRLDGPEHCIEIDIDLTALTQTETVQSDTIFFPKNARITKVEVVTKVAAATGVAVDLGLIQTDRSTEIDFNGILAAFPTASMNVIGETTVLYNGTTYAGALVGPTNSTSGYISASATTATAFTTGEILVRIYWIAV